MHIHETLTDLDGGFGPYPDGLPFDAFRKPFVKFPSLSGAFAYRTGGDAEHLGDGLDLGRKLLGVGAHDRQDNVIFHRSQRETSHSQADESCGKFLSMDEGEIFRRNLLRVIKERGLSEAQLSKLASLNPRAVTDIRERRVASPKLSTVFALAKALDMDPGELLGLGKRHNLRPELAEFLEQLSVEEQSRFLAALSAIPRQPL